jgi:uncharacterized metal-binding protein
MYAGELLAIYAFLQFMIMSIVIAIHLVVIFIKCIKNIDYNDQNEEIFKIVILILKDTSLQMVVDIIVNWITQKRTKKRNK